MLDTSKRNSRSTREHSPLNPKVRKQREETLLKLRTENEEDRIYIFGTLEEMLHLITLS